MSSFIAFVVERLVGSRWILPFLNSCYFLSPEFVDSIQDDQLRQWALDLNAIWRELGRQLSPDVSVNPKRHSLLTVPNPFIVAGGRFSEFYYW